MDAPTIIPLLLTGVLVGILLRGTDAKITKRLAILGSLAAGAANAGYAAALFYLGNSTTATSNAAATRVFTAARTTTQTSLTASATFAFIVGALMVLLVLFGAVLTLKIRGRKHAEEQ